MSRQNTLADSFYIEPAEKLPHLRIHELPVRYIRHPTNEDAPFLLDWLGPVLASTFPIEAVVDRRGIGGHGSGREVECSVFALLHLRFDAARAVGAGAGVAVDFDGAVADAVAPESLDYLFWVFGWVEVDEAVGGVSAGERVDGHVEVEAEMVSFGC